MRKRALGNVNVYHVASKNSTGSGRGLLPPTLVVKVQIKTTKCRSPCDLYISKNVSKHYAREKCEHINNKSTIQN